MVEHLMQQGWLREQIHMIDMDAGISGTKKISVLKGKLVALVPGPLTDFRFDALPLAAAGARPKAVEQR